MESVQSQFSARRMHTAFSSVGLPLLTVCVAVALYMTGNVLDLQSQNYNKGSSTEKHAYSLAMASAITSWAAVVLAFVFAFLQNRG